MKKLLIIDRDGTLIKHIPYLGDPRLVELEEYAGQVLYELSKRNFVFAVATNQSAIARGFISDSDVLKVNKEVTDLLFNFGVKIESIEYCPHSPDDLCSCRKPRIDMGLRILSKLNIDRVDTFMIGDNDSDIEFAINLGVTMIPYKNYCNSKEFDQLKCENWLQVLDKIDFLI
jgi:histidinol-phosphate phosphatase family protein